MEHLEKFRTLINSNPAAIQDSKIKLKIQHLMNTDEEVDLDSIKDEVDRRISR